LFTVSAKHSGLSANTYTGQIAHRPSPNLQRGTLTTVNIFGDAIRSTERAADGDSIAVPNPRCEADRWFVYGPGLERPVVTVSACLYWTHSTSTRCTRAGLGQPTVVVVGGLRPPASPPARSGCRCVRPAEPMRRGFTRAASRLTGTGPAGAVLDSPRKRIPSGLTVDLRDDLRHSDPPALRSHRAWRSAPPRSQSA